MHGLHSDLIKTIIIMGAMITTIWIIFRFIPLFFSQILPLISFFLSFSLAYGEDANGDQIMGYPKTYYMFHSTGSGSAAANGASTIPNSIFAVFELGFALVTPTIIAASVSGEIFSILNFLENNFLPWIFLSGRVNINAFLIYIFIWHLVIYCPIAHIVWFPTGWFPTHIIEDFAGGERKVLFFFSADRF